MGENADGNVEVFAIDLCSDPAVTTQITYTTGGTDQALAVLSGTRIVFSSSADPTGTDADGGLNIFLAEFSDLIAPEPPAGPWRTSAAIPDFRFEVRITPPGGPSRLGFQPSTVRGPPRAARGGGRRGAHAQGLRPAPRRAERPEASAGQRGSPGEPVEGPRASSFERSSPFQTRSREERFSSPDPPSRTKTTRQGFVGGASFLDGHGTAAT